MPEQFSFRDLEDLDKAQQCLRDVNLSVTDYANRMIIGSQIFAAHKTKIAGENLAASMTVLAEALKEGLNNHADALRAAAKSSDKHARSLNFATWALVAATALLFLAAGAQLGWTIYAALHGLD
jgi:hypothetical protein